MLNRQSDKDLKDEEMEITEYVNYNRHLPQTFESKYQQIIFTKVIPNSVQRQFVDTLILKNGMPIILSDKNIMEMANMMLVAH